MTSELTLLHQKLQQANTAEDLFGVPERVAFSNTEKLSKIIKGIYKRLIKIAHPDKYTHILEKKRANEAFVLLNRFYNHALAKIERHIYGKGYDDQVVAGEEDFIVTTAKQQYKINTTIAMGDLCTVYGGQIVTNNRTNNRDNEIAIKMVDDVADNDLMQNEYRILGLLHQGNAVHKKHLPQLIDRFKSEQGQQATIMRRIEGYDLHSIREKYSNGLPEKHIIWIFRRLLSALGYAHSKGIIHGNIEPSHIMVRPRDHNVYLLDWCYSIYKPAVTGQGFRVFNEEYSPPEVALGKPPVPSSDLYSLGKCMIYLLGGDTKNLTLANNIPDKIQRFIKYFCRESVIQRPRDAWEMYAKLDQLRQQLFGRHCFQTFKM